MLFLSETYIEKDAAEQMKDKIGFSNAIGASSVGLASGLCQMWNNAFISFTLVSFSQNHICGDVVGKGDMRWQFIGNRVDGLRTLTSTKHGLFFVLSALILIFLLSKNKV